MKQLLIIILTIFTLSSCCTFATDPKYTVPKTTEIKTVYASPYTKPYIWDHIIQFLSGPYSPYTINSVDYPEGTITFSYSGDPCPYVDCGMLVADFTMPERNEIYEKHPTCKEYLEYTVCDENEKPCETKVKRSMHLETSTTIILTQSTNAVRVDMMTLYRLTKEISLYDEYGLFKGHLYDEITFPTHSSGQFPETPTVCKSNGNIELDIMELVQ